MYECLIIALMIRSKEVATGNQPARAALGVAGAKARVGGSLRVSRRLRNQIFARPGASPQFTRRNSRILNTQHLLTRQRKGGGGRAEGRRRRQEKSRGFRRRVVGGGRGLIC